jgi:hypothetical protein
MSLTSGEEPSIYDNKYYTRFGSNIEEIKPKNLLEFMKRFA